MKVRYKDSKEETISVKFNITAVVPAEVILPYDSEYVSVLEVFLKATGKWKDMQQAFKDHDLITDNENYHFFEPQNEKDRKKGYAM